MTASEAAEGVPKSGLGLVLPAMAVASVLGYVVQVIVPPAIGPHDYAGFSAYWSALFLCVAALSGVQQEFSRATTVARRPSDGSAAAIRRFTVIAVVAATAVGAVVGVLVAVTLVRQDVLAIAVSTAFGLAGYVVLAVVLGQLFGTRTWTYAALGMFADPLVRAVLIAALAAAAAVGASGVGVGWWAVAVAAPFPIAALALWLVSRRQLANRVNVDVGVGGLLRNSSHTVVAATSLGFVSLGLPLVVNVISAGTAPTEVAGVLLVISLARAPIVSPMLALQSYLTVSFRTHADHLVRRMSLLAGAVLAVGALAAVAGAAVIPPLMQWLFPGFGVPSAAFNVVAIASAALVAVQCVTGPAVLSRQRHRAYAAGWLTTALVAVAAAAVPLPFEPRVMLMLAVAPLAGCLVHLLAVTRSAD